MSVDRLETRLRTVKTDEIKILTFVTSWLCSVQNAGNWLTQLGIF